MVNSQVGGYKISLASRFKPCKFLFKPFIVCRAFYVNVDKNSTDVSSNDLAQSVLDSLTFL